MAATSHLLEFERFIESDEGREWLKRRGWVKSRTVMDRAIIMPVESEDILEDALLVMVVRAGEGEAVNGWPPRGGSLGAVALVEEDTRVVHGAERE